MNIDAACLEKFAMILVGTSVAGAGVVGVSLPNGVIESLAGGFGLCDWFVQSGSCLGSRRSLNPRRLFGAKRLLRARSLAGTHNWAVARLARHASFAGSAGSDALCCHGMGPQPRMPSFWIKLL